MRKLLFTINFVCLFLLITASFLQAQENLKYRYTDKNRFKKTDPTGPDLEFVFLTLPATNDYQVISNINTHGGELFTSNPGSVEKYVRYTISKEMQPTLDGWYEVTLEFDYEPTETEYSNAIVGNIYPYDTASYLYKRYTAKYYGFIDTDNITMKQASDKLWANSSNVYDYSKKCFDYVHTTFEFKNMGTGWLSISKLISNGGGDCGNLSSLFITLLRCKNVPARHVTVPGHAWAEFYLEGYGWIPVDPTFGYFGKATSNYGVIWSNEIVFQVKTSKQDLLYIDGLGQGHYPYPSHNYYQCDRITSQVIASINKPDIQKFKTFPNPTNGLVFISFENSVKKAKVEIHSVQGTLVFSKTFQNTPSATIDLTGNSAGIYVVKVITDGVSYEEKIVKE